MGWMLDSAGCYWGVDSYTPAYRPGQPCLFDMVVREKGRAPSYWGRYIRCPNANDENVLTPDERDFLLLRRNCAILPIYNGTIWQRCHNGWYRGTFVDGVEDAYRALNAANSLEIPENVCIYADLEPAWGGVTAAWILGWWCVFFDTPYRPGLYCTGWSAHGPYNIARDLIKSADRPDWLQWHQWPLWRQISNIDTWSSMWAILPHLGGFRSPPSWQPREPFPSAAQVWQYDVEHWLQGWAKVDSDLATMWGFDSMWQATAPPWSA